MARDRTPDSHGDAVVATAKYDTDGGTELSTSVLMTLDEIPEYDIENTNDVIVRHVDLEALDDLFTPTSDAEPEGYVSFPVNEYGVTVTANGDITVTERQSADD